jgi:serine/threonine protein kinase
MTREGMEIGHYRLVRLLGQGGMGEVYLAQDTRIERNVAIKIVRDEVSPYPQSDTAKDAARLFEREMKAITALDHPHILPLYDFGEEKVSGEDLIYMVMPYRQEGSLTDWLRTRNASDQLSPRVVIAFIHQAASALQHAHNHRLMHLDVKLSNFLVRSREDRPDCPDLLLADFGISKFSTATATASQSIRGTPLSMAPEQWNGTPVPATDQYALAIMAYQLLTGQSPFQGSMQQLMYQHLFQSPLPPGTCNPRIPQAVDAVILKALAKRPEDRFPSVSEFANAFEQAWQSEAVTLVPAQKPPLPTVYAVPAPPPREFPRAEMLPGKPEASPQKQGNKWLFPAIIALLVLISSGSLIFILTRPSQPAASSSSSSLSGTSSSPPVSPSPTITAPPTATLPATAAPTIPQLKSYYSGTATGYMNAYVTFTLESEDSQGNVTMTTTFEQAADLQKIATYTCSGNVTSNQSLFLSCYAPANANYLLTIQATILPNGSMQGTEIATVNGDASYRHFYNWTAS